MLVLAKIYPLINKLGDPKATDLFLMSTTVFVTIVISFFQPICDMVMLQRARRLMAATFFGWLIIRRMQKAISDIEFLVGISNNIMSNILQN